MAPKGVSSLPDDPLAALPDDPLAATAPKAKARGLESLPDDPLGHLPDDPLQVPQDRVIPAGIPNMTTIPGLSRTAALDGVAKPQTPPLALQKQIDSDKAARQAVVDDLVSKGMPRDQAEQYQIGTVSGMSPEAWQDSQAQDEARRKSPSLRALEGFAHGVAKPFVTLANTPSGLVRESGKLVADAPGLEGVGQSIQGAGQSMRPLSAQEVLKQSTPKTDVGKVSDFLGNVFGMVPTLGNLGPVGFATQSAGNTMNEALDSGSGSLPTLAAGGGQALKDLVLFKAFSLIPALRTENKAIGEAVDHMSRNVGMGMGFTYAGNAIDKFTWDPKRGIVDGTPDAVAVGIAFGLLGLFGRKAPTASTEQEPGATGSTKSDYSQDTAAARASDSATVNFVSDYIKNAPDWKAAEIQRQKMRSKFTGMKDGDYFVGKFDEFFPRITSKNWEAWKPQVPGMDFSPKPQPTQAEPAKGNSPLATPTPEATSAQEPVPAAQTTPGPQGPVAENGSMQGQVPDVQAGAPAEPIAGSPTSGPGAGAGGDTGRTPSPEVEVLAEQVQQLEQLSTQMDARAKQHPHVEEAQHDAEEASDLLQAAKDRLAYIVPDHPVLAPPAPPEEAKPTPAQVQALQPTGTATTPEDLTPQTQTTDTIPGATDGALDSSSGSGAPTRLPSRDAAGAVPDQVAGNGAANGPKASPAGHAAGKLLDAIGDSSHPIHERLDKIEPKSTDLVEHTAKDAEGVDHSFTVDPDKSSIHLMGEKGKDGRTVEGWFQVMPGGDLVVRSIDNGGFKGLGPDMNRAILTFAKENYREVTDKSKVFGSVSESGKKARMRLEGTEIHDLKGRTVAVNRVGDYYPKAEEVAKPVTKTEAPSELNSRVREELEKRTGIPTTQKYVDSLEHSIQNLEYNDTLDPANKNSRAVFTKLTGRPLPNSIKATKEVLEKMKARKAVANPAAEAKPADEAKPEKPAEVAEKPKKTETLPEKETPNARAAGGVESGGRKTGAPGRSKARPVDEAVSGGQPGEFPPRGTEAVHADLPATAEGGDGAASSPRGGVSADVRSDGSGSGKPTTGVKDVPADQTADGGQAPKDEQPKAPRNSRNHRIEKQEDITPFDLSSEAQSKKAARANIDALKLMKKLEAEGRKATSEEQKALAKYVGWGATTLSKMVDWSRGNRALQATKLKEALETLKSQVGNNAAYPSDIIDQVREVLGWSDSNRMGYSYGRPLVGDLLAKTNQLLDGSTTSIGNTGTIEPAWMKDFFPFYRELADILSPEEMKAAWNSTLNAHFTSVPVVKGMWDMVRRMGFKGGTVLEPSAGVGNFMGLMPPDLLPNSALQAVELDKMTGTFLKQLYPDAKVHIRGFQDAKIPANSQDLVITNVPFGDISISDKAHPEWGSPSIHNYFFLKGMEKLKPGGLMVAITSHFTMDSQGAGHRKAMAGMGDLVGAIRLPRTAFKANAGTEVVTDILILRKKAGDGFRGEPFQAALPTSMGLNRAGEEVVVPVNEYFKQHPDMVLGEYGVGTMRGNEELTVNPRGDLAEEMAKATKNLPQDIASRFVTQGHDENEIHTDDEDPQAEGHLFVKGGQPMVIDEGKTVLHPWVAEAVQKWPDKPARAQERAKIVKNYVGLRDEALSQVARMMSDATTDEELAKGRETLTKAYDAFTMRGPKQGFVPINDPSNASVFGDESSWARVCALENEQEQENGRPNYTKADIFSKRTIEPFKEPSKADSISDAVEISMNMRGGLDLDYMGKLRGADAEAIKQELAGADLAFDDPASGIWEPAYLYLGGEVRKKLQEAQEAAKDNEAFQRHVKALEAVQPEWMELGRITAQPGATWLPERAIGDLVRYATGLKVTGLRKDPISGRWVLDDADLHSRAVWDDLSVPAEIRPWKFAEAVLLNKPLKVTWKDDDGATHVDVVRTQQAQEAKSKAVERWHEGFYKISDEGRKIVEDAFNTEVNNSVPVQYPEPAADRFPGMATEWGGRPLKLESYQKIGVSRALKNSVLLGHAVGSGKTITLISTAMEQRRLGFAKRPMISVLNSTVKQFVNAAYQLYPNAKILAPGKSERSAKDRAKLYARIATGDWDMVIIPQSFYEMIPVSADRVRAWIDAQVSEINEAIKEAKGDKFKIKDLERLRDSIRGQGDKMMAATNEGGEPGEEGDAPSEKAKAATSKQAAKKAAKTTDRLSDLASRKSDRFATFEDLGIDSLLVDEAHGFKNGFFMTSLNNVKGLNPSASSKRAVGMLLKARSIQEKTAGKNITMATGTPITNTMSEAWVMMNYVRPDLLEEGGVSKFDEFISTYGDINSDTEYSASGKFEPVERLREFVNLQQLGKLWNQAVHVVPQKMILRDKLPKTLSRTVMVKPTAAQEEESSWWRGLMDEWKTWDREEKQKVPVGLLYSQISKFLSLDMRTIKRGLDLSEAGGKVPAMVQEAMKLYKQYDKDKAAQAIFCDVKNAWKAEGDVWTRLGRTGGEPGFNVFKEVKFQLMKAGVPEHEIVIVDDIPDKDDVRAEVFDKVNRGDVRFIIGSTQRLGTGVNIQTRLIAMHNLDIPGRPCDNTQRLGRGERAGNMFDEIHWLTYGVEKTLDALMAQRNLNKTKFIQQIMEGLFEGDKAEDIGTEATFSWAEIRGALSGDPRVMRYGELQGQIQKMVSKLNAWDQGRGDARVKLNNAKREIEKFTTESEALSKFAGEVPSIQDELAKQSEALKKDKDSSDPLETWTEGIDKKVQKRDVSSSIGYENREFPTKLSNGMTLIRRATADWNILDRPEGGASVKIQVVLEGTGLPDSVAPRSGTSSPRLSFAMDAMSRALEKTQEFADVRKKWLNEAKEAIPVLEAKQGPFPDQEKLNDMRKEASDLEAAINETAEEEKRVRDEAKKVSGDEVQVVPKEAWLDRINQEEGRSGERGAAAVDLLTAPAHLIKALGNTGVAQALGKALDGIQAIVAPSSMNNLSQRAADVHSGKLGRLHLQDARARNVLESAHKAMAKLSHDQVLDLFDVLEGKTDLGTVGDKALADAVQFMRNTLDQDYRDIVATGKSLNYIESYFPHMYAKPEKARPFLEEYAKRPMEGTKDWAKHRSIPYLSDAVRERGLEPASWNPIDMFLARHFDMQKFVTAHQILDSYIKEKLARYFKASRSAPEGWRALDDRIAVVSSIKSAVVKNEETGKFEAQPLVPGAMTVYGQYYAPEEVARIFNNYLTPGFTGSLLGKPYEFARTTNNLLNMAQLGLSAFHATFITIEGAAGGMSRGLMKVFRDGSLEGLVDVAKGAALPLSVAETMKDGLKFRKALLSDECPPEFRPLRDMFIRGGGRVGMDREYGTPFARLFVEAWQKGLRTVDMKVALKGIASTPFALVEALSKPIMQFYVPVMKLGTMAQLFADEMARLPKDATPAQIDRVARKVVDHVEDRMGQMTYDNLHWHAMTKQIMHLSLRAVGWDVGSWRMIIGAGHDLAAAAPRAARALGAAMSNDPEFQKEIEEEIDRRDKAAGEYGHNRWMTYNIAQTFSVMAVVGILSGLMTWLLTGEPPKEAKDFLFFRTGRKDKYGKDERLQFASYAKEVMDLLHIAMEAAPIHLEKGKPTLGFNLSPAMKYLWGKRAPFIGAVEKFGSNRDWKGQQVYTPNDGRKTLEDVGLAALREFLPISVVQSAEKWEVQGGGKSVLPTLGLTKPKQEMINTKAENKLVEMLADRMPRVIEKAKGDREAQIRMAKDAYVLGNRKPMDELKEQGLLTVRDQKNIIGNFRNQSLLTRLSNATNIDAHDLIKVWDDMDKSEKIAVFPAVARKLGSSFKSTPPAQREALKEKWKAIQEEVKSIKAEPRSSK